MTNSMVDVIALPNGFHGGGDSGVVSNETQLLGEAMAELVNQNRGLMEVGRADLHWRGERKTALRTVRSLGDLRKRLKVLLKLRGKIYQRMLRNARNTCKRSGWVDTHRIEACATTGYLTKIVMETLNWYISLHQHLLEMGSESWAFAITEKEYHVEEMEVIRNTSDSRLQCMCSLYV
jgi:hypothetical protein